MESLFLTQLSTTEIRQLVGEEIRKALIEFSPIPKEDTKQILNFDEACDFLSISKSHGYKLTSKGLIPHSKRGKRIYFRKSDLSEWLLSNKVKTVADLTETMDSYLKSNSRNR